jgi:hypothetical protein
LWLSASELRIAHRDFKVILNNAGEIILNMGKKTKITECVYCGQRKETTRDHVFSKNLFPKSYKKKNVIIVPSCAKCNRGFSLDEEYFRFFLCGAGLEYSQHADELFFTKVKRCVQRRPQIVSKLLNQMDLIDVYTKSGIYIGKKTRFSIPDEDWKRYCNVLTKYVKGLFFHELKQILPLSYGIMHFLGNEKMLELLRYISKWNWDDKDIFAYGYSFVANTYESAWVTLFYDSVFFVSFAAPEHCFELVKKSEFSKRA